MNSAGQVIGINTAVAADGAQNIGFAIPIDKARTLWPTGSRPVRGRPRWPSSACRPPRRRTGAAGRRSCELVAGGPAQRAGIAVGDLIVTFDGKAVSSAPTALSGLVQARQPGDTVQVVVERNGSSRIDLRDARHEARQLMSGRLPGLAPEPAESADVERAMFEVKRVIVGQDRVIERLFVAIIARGHCLLEGAPGLAKTLAAETLATVVGGSFVRLQFTPDLVPSDIVGHPDLPAVERAVRHRARPDLRQRGPGRRDQPGAGQGAVGAARGHGRTPGVGRRA